MTETSKLLTPDHPAADQKDYELPGGVVLKFQKGAMELGRNGVITEEVLETLIDHVSGFQQGPFACEENAAIIYHASQAKAWARLRKDRRVAAGVKGREGAHYPTPDEQHEPILQFFEYRHLPGALSLVSQPFCLLAQELVATTPRNAERTVALRKLLEAKDAAVRSAMTRPGPGAIGGSFTEQR